MDINSIINFLNFDRISAIVFIIFLVVFLYVKRKKLDVQKIAYPFIYIVLYRTKIGIKLIDRIAKKYKEIIKLIGYCFIGFGFLGMVVISLSILSNIISLILKPKVTESGVALIVPFTNVPGIGYLSFWQFMISLFVIVVIHEFSHGIVARAHGLKIRSSGFAFLAILIPFLPAAFVEPDEKELKKQKDIVQQSIFAAGPLANIVLATIIFFALFTPLFGIGIPAIEKKITEPTGFSFNLINSSFPTAKAGMHNGMTITGLNGEKIKDFNSFAYKMMCIKPGQNITITASNKTENKSFLLTTVESPYEKGRAFIGIRPLQNEVIFKGEYKEYSFLFSWIKGLLKWLFFLNLFIGLANLLPLGIVDGGRMLEIALNSTVKSRKKAKKIWSAISIGFLVMLLFALIVRYLGNPFAIF